MSQAVSIIDASYQEVVDNARPTWYRASLYGYLLILVFFGGFGSWAALAPLASAVIAIGELRVDTERKMVQHHQGGIVKEILVEEGERVREGQVLVRLDPVRTTAEFDIQINNFRVNLAQEARLIAELNEASEVEFPAELLKDRDDPAAALMMRTQRTLFDSRRTSLRGQIDVQRERMAQAHTDVQATQDRRKTMLRQLGLINEELDGVRELYEKGFAPKTRLLALERAKTGIEGDLADNGSNLKRNHQRITEIELQIADMQQQFMNAVIGELRTIQAQIPEIEERMRVTRDNLRRLDVVAPRAGKVVDRKIHTIGGIVGPAQTMMDIVPEDDELVVVARVQTKDVDSVKLGAPVQVRLTSFSQRYTHPINGVLKSVSADTIEGGTRPDATGRPSMPYYKALIKLDPISREQILPDVDLVSGMPAQALIAVGERTLLQYWLTPLIRSFELSLNEP
jgi:HlyD family type I secretion membrane fusion protein